MSIDRSLRQYQLGLVVADTVALTAAFFLAHGIRVGSLGGIPGPYLMALPYTLFVFLLAFRYFKTYRQHRGGFRELLRITAGVAGGMMIVLSLGFFYRGFSFSRLTALLFPALAIAFVFLFRALYRKVLQASFGNSRWLKRVLLVGDSPATMQLQEELSELRSDYLPVGILSRQKKAHTSSKPPLLADFAYFDGTENVGQVLNMVKPDLVIVADPNVPDAEQRGIIDACIQRDIHWKLVPRINAPPDQDIGLTVVAGVPLLGSRGNNITGFNYSTKRALDTLLALGLVLISSPLLLFVAAAIKLVSPGPVLFAQERVGYRGKRFSFYKFRSMHVANDEKVHREYVEKWINGAEDEETDSDGTTVHKLTDDPRIIPFIGKFIRKWSIDELPQLFNVVRGDMSLVGPRPCLPYEAELYERRHRMRFDVLPGITGLWQVSGRNRLTFDQMVALDIRYLQDWSLSKDLSIMVRTPYAILFDKAY